jgi:hypothetical protein
MDSMFWLFKQLVGVGLALVGIGIALVVVVLVVVGGWKLLAVVLKGLLEIVVVIVAILLRPFLLPIRWYRLRKVPRSEWPPMPPLPGFDLDPKKASLKPAVPLSGEPSEECIDRIHARLGGKRSDAVAHARKRRALGYDD